jgi:dihydrofolate reductase
MELTMKMIVAMDPTGIIGVNGGMPWHYREDFRRFKKLTMGGTLIMGRKTWDSLPGGLPGRRTIVISRQKLDSDVEIYASVDTALLAAGSDQHGTNGDVWVCGGAEIYRLFLEKACADIAEVDVTIVPAVTEFPEGAVVTRFPVNLLEERYTVKSERQNAEDPRLIHRQYVRK